MGGPGTALAIHRAEPRDPVQVPRLLVHGVDVDAVDANGNTPLICAIEVGAAAISRARVDAGARVDVANDFGTTPRSLAVGYGHREIVAVLDAAPAPARHIALAQ